MNKRRVLLWIVTVCLLAALIPSTVFAASNGWNKNADGSWSYYNADWDYWYTDGVYEIEGEYYGFDTNGIMYENQWHKQGSIYYYFDANGRAYKNGVYKIGVKYYGFDWDGWMHADTSFSVYDETVEKWIYYRAKADGSLYVNEWYKDGSIYYYFDADGKMCRNEVRKIGSNYYGFDWDGWMYTDTVFSVYDEAAEKEVYYHAKADGTLYAGLWRQEDGDYYYYFPNGEMCRSGVYQIGGNYYGFDWSGRMYADTAFGIDHYDSASEEWKYTYYRAKADGSLYVNTWYENDDDWYYYGAGGVAADDFKMIGTTWYFFEEGYMITDQMVYSENYKAYYYISKDGTSSVKAKANGWFKADDDYYYFENNEMYCGDVYKIGSKYYGFRWDGRMYEDQRFGIDYYDEELGHWVYEYYCAKADGSLYVNEWYEEGGDRYFFGAAGVAPNDFKLINDTWYFFENGRMITNRLVQSEQDGKFYVISADGKSYRQISGNGWAAVGEDYYYILNNRICRDVVIKIGSKYYGFDYEGRMYENRRFWSNYYDEAQDMHYSGSFRAKVDGSLYVNEWYEEGEDRYYYGAAGLGAKDFVMIGGTWYFFEDAYMVTERLVWSDAYNGYYVISADGKSSRQITKDGWVSVGEDYYYILNGTKCESSVVEIGSKYYGFDWNGRMYKNTTFSRSHWDDAQGIWVYNSYRAKADGTLYVNEWYQDGSEWYYYGAAGAGADERFMQVGSVWYYFYGARMVKDQVVYEDGKAYALDKNGQQIKTPGKQAVNGYYVYVKTDGTLKTDGWVSISGKYYYFAPRMKANCLFTDEDGALYAVNNAGVCVAVTGNGIYDIGSLVYLENGKIFTGWKNVDGGWRYFDTAMVMNGTYEIDDEWYVFDKNGKMFTGGWLFISMGYGDAYSYAYADASGKAATGLKTIGGKTYAFHEYGYLCTDTTVNIDGVTYITDENGVATKVDMKDGWKTIDGKYYYVKNGQFVTDRTEVIGGKRYGFDYDGIMCSDGFYTFWWNGYEAVILGADGVAKTGWQKLGNLWYYGGADGLLVNGRQTIGGKDYIFSENVMQVGTFQWNDKVVTTDANGIIVSEKNCADGWSYIDGSVYYYKNGKPYTGWVGDYHIQEGYMQWGGVITVDGKPYVLDNYGRYVKSGWYCIDRSIYYGREYITYVYAKAGGVLCCNEWLQLGSNWYYFDSDSHMVEDCVMEIDGELHKFAAGGKYLGKMRDLIGTKDGWKQVGSDWYYIHAGEPITGAHYIGGKYYVFDYEGVMLSDCFAYCGEDYNDYCYVNSNGEKAAYTGWKKINGEWCYFTKDNNVVRGWFQDGGKTYYAENIEKNGKLCVGLFSGYMSDGEYLHYFGSDGVYQGTRGVENGWYQAGGEWYYFRNGRLVHGHQVIGGKSYYFSGGAMVTNDIYGYAYYGADGVQRTTKGWYQTSFGWIYVGENGVLYDGIYNIGGKQYCFLGGIMV